MSTPNSLQRNDILFKETKNSKQRFYVKQPDVDEAVVVNVSNTDHIGNSLKRIFLPDGYPGSVSKDYAAYQKWDTAQAFCSTIAGILATQEVLRGVGVGDSSATALAATITWVLKDGCGHIGKILFAFTHGKYLDAYSKKWRMYADILNNAAMCIEIALPQFKRHSWFALCISTLMKSIVGVAGGATRVAMTQHHAVVGNFADVAAKDAAQETAVNLLASLVALAVLSILGESALIFTLMMFLHVMFNYFAVRAVCLRTLNEPRFLMLIDKYARQQVIATPCLMNRLEPVIFYQMGRSILDLKICGFKIKLGSSVLEAFAGRPEADELKYLRDIYSTKPYVLVTSVERRVIHVLIRRSAVPEDVLCAYFHAVLLAYAICAINDDPASPDTVPNPPPIGIVCATMQSEHWDRQARRGAKRRNPSAELLIYLDEVAAREWVNLRTGLKRQGWEVGTHQLVTDQWRLEPTPPPKLSAPSSAEASSARVPAAGGVLKQRLVNPDVQT